MSVPAPEGQEATPEPQMAFPGLAPARRRNLLRMYGLTDEDFRHLLNDCNDRCPMCLKPFGPALGRAPCVEHDHRTWEVHGLADSWCNDLLGRYGRDPAYYRRVAEFLESPPARRVFGGPRYVPGSPHDGGET